MAHPSAISPPDKLLASRIVLPPSPSILYALFRPSLVSPPHDAIELARRSILARNDSTHLLASFLPSVHIGPDSFIYVFRISSPETHAQDAAALDALQLDGLIGASTSAAELRAKTGNATDPAAYANPNLIALESAGLDPRDLYASAPPASSSFPQPAKRLVFSHFLDAVRTRLIDDIIKTATSNACSRNHVRRLKHGFLFSQPALSTDWSSAWEYKAATRPLTFCHIQLQLSCPSPEVVHLVIHPTLLSTPYLDLKHSPPLPAGTPIALLPHGTPAYFLASYTGPTSGLSKQFRESLHGLGAGVWEADSSRNSTTPFIIGWIKVENKQGEDKGITIIYPTRLCLAYQPSSPPRPPLDYIPELPAQLQPSPQVPSAIPCVSTSLLAQLDSSARPHTPPLQRPYPLRPPLASSPTSDSLRAFRSLTLSKAKDIQRVASEVGGYVDSVAKERERERERLKRERENLTSSPKLARTTVTTPAASGPTPITTDAPAQAHAPAHPPQPVPQPIPGPSQLQPPPSQNFYPSPPQTNPSIIPPLSDGKTSPSIESAPSTSTLPPPDTRASTATLHTASTEPTPAPPPSSSGSSYDPFANIDPSWSQSSTAYLGMDVDDGMQFGMDMDMGFGMPIGSASNAGGGGGDSYNDYGGGMDYEDAFTDDDFSFFDRPSRTSAVPPPPNTFPTRGGGVSGAGGILTHPVPSTPLGLGLSPPFFGADVHLSGPGALQPTPGSHVAAAWTPGLFDAFTPHSAEQHDTVPPELLPPSPGQTPNSHSAPQTPNIRLEYNPGVRRPSWGASTAVGTGPGLFDAIPFAPSHRAADGKYTAGKFALPSPPDEEDRTESFFLSSSSSSSASPKGSAGGWIQRYKAATDPSIGLVRKLIGVKRKAPTNPLVQPPSKTSPWLREHEDWAKTPSASAATADEEDDAKSELDSDEDEDESLGTDSPLVSRPTTPPPAYIPLGPTLLHTQFQHAQLLPLSMPLRPPGAAVAPTSIPLSLPLASVPTPVSPAATMGAASEKSKSLEAAAATVAVEVVENALWAETWRANAVGTKRPMEIWTADVKTVAQLFESVPTLEGPLDMATLFELEATNKSLQVLEAPMISIGKGDTVVQVLPTALRFWEKLGLGPKGGRKNVTVFALFEDDTEQRLSQVEGWLASLGAAYQGKHLGEFSLGSSSACTKDGLVPLRFDPSFRKSLANFISSLSPSDSTLVFLTVLPITTMSLSSPILRQILSAVKKALKAYPEGQVVFQFVPEHYILGSMEQSSACDMHVETLCSSLYDRILLPVDRLMSHRIADTEDPIRRYFQEPAFTLARPLHARVSYARAAHAPLDVMDRHSLLHVGYCISRCGKWIVASCVDQRGESYDLGVWLTQTPGEQEGEAEISDEAYAIKKVWDFAIKFAKRANIEWRLVFSKLGTMSEIELAAWEKHLARAIFVDREFTMGHISLVSVEQDAPWLFITTRPTSSNTSRLTPPQRSSSMKHHSPTLFTDASSTTYALFPSTQLPILLPPSASDLGATTSFVAEPSSFSQTHSPRSNPGTPSVATPSPTSPTDSSGSFTSIPMPHPLTCLPRSTASLIRVPCSPSPTTITMLHIYLLHTLQCPQSPPPFLDESTLHTDITRNYYDLAVLAKTRLKLDINPILPFHLAAVEAMRIALDRDLDRMESIVDS